MFLLHRWGRVVSVTAFYDSVGVAALGPSPQTDDALVRHLVGRALEDDAVAVSKVNGEVPFKKRGGAGGGGGNKNIRNDIVSPAEVAERSTVFIPHHHRPIKPETSGLTNPEDKRYVCGSLCVRVGAADWWG